MLIYRAPGKDVIQKSGYFEKVSSLPSKGFVVSDFSGETQYIFIESEHRNTSYKKSNDILVIEHEEYIRKATILISTLKGIGIKKAVFSRIKKLDFDESKSLNLFHALEKAYPKAFVYLFKDENLGTWIGASPEILLRKINNNGFTISLAGTKSASDISSWSDKEKIEQAYVSEFIEDELTTLNLSNIERSETYEHTAGPVKHLRTDFNFSIGQVELCDILKGLHPTPAVCGLPQNLAEELINQIESHNREFYTGYIGEFDENMASIFVNLRCCQITTGSIYLYVGGGYTVDSDPELEWIETENKAQTIIELIQKV
jgi:isochorismate synthase